MGLRPTTTAAATLSIAVSGNHFVNGSGQTIRVLGVNRSGSEYMCTGGGGQTFDGPTDDASIAAIAAWHTSAVRVPLNEDCWLGINGLPSGQSAASYRQAIVAFVNALHIHGQYVILDLHWNDGGSAPATGQQGMADADHAPAFWTSVAATFKGDPAVIFDLYNEPHDISWDCWKSGGCSDPVGGFTVAGMQTLLDAVRATGSTQPIMVGGLGYSGDVSQWLAFKPSDPANQLVASFHTYNFSGCDSSCWDNNVRPITTSYPVVTGELGEDDCQHGYIDSYMNWADQNGVSYLGWGWDTYDCGSFPSLISDYSGTPTGFGVGLQSHLTALAGAPQPLSASASASVTIGVPPLAVNFTGSESGGTAPYTYSWDFGDGTPTSSSQNPSHTYAASGTFTAQLTVTDSSAQTATATAPPVTVGASLGVTATATPTQGGVPLAVGFTAAASGGTGPYSYAWDFGDGSTAGGATPTHTYTIVGSYVATVIVTDAGAGTATGQVTVTATASAALSASAGASLTWGPTPLTVDFTGSVTGGTTPYRYSWDFGDGTAVSSSQNPSHVYTTPGIYMATLTVADATGQAATAQVTVTVIGSAGGNRIRA